MINRIFSLLALAAISLGATVASAGAPIFPWPDPATHPRVILKADQSLEEYLDKHPEWFKNDFLVAGLYTKGVESEQVMEAIQTFQYLRSQLLKDGIYVGTPVSGTTALPDTSKSTFPAEAALISDMPQKTHYLGKWSRDSDQVMVDLSDKVSREGLQKAIAGLWRRLPATIHYIDNAAVHPGIARIQPWEAYCRNMQELAMAAGALRSRVIFNVYMKPWQLTNEEATQLIGSVGSGNAIALPYAWTKELATDKNANGWAVYRYRQLLDAGIVVIMVPGVDADADALEEWASAWRRPTDRLYVAGYFWEEPR